MDQNGQTRRGAIGALMSSLAVPHVAPTAFARTHATDVVATNNIFVAVDLAAATAAGEAALGEGAYFKAVGTSDAVAEFRIRTADGSNLLYEEVAKAALQSTDVGKGADMVSLPLPFANAVSTTVAARVRASAFNAAEVGMKGEASPSVNAAAFQKAIDYTREAGIALELPGGEIQLDGDVTIAPLPDAASADRVFTMWGQGAGKKGTFLHFTNGSLIVHSNHQLSSFHITSNDADGLMIAPRASPVHYPTRSGLRDVRAEHCAGSGITIEDTWNYVMDNVYARYNDGWGVEGKAGPNFRMSSNAWTIIGGEFQGNGTKQGAKAGTHGSTERGTGGGIFTGRAVQLVVIGAAIEGNVGDGLKLGEEMRGLSLIGVYFEKNGSHHTNCDICNDPPTRAALGPTSVSILNSNFTPQSYNFSHSGIVQERAIDLYDASALKIVNPMFFSSADSGSTAGYSRPPIRVRETLSGRCTGWVENPQPLWSGYEQLLTNETHRFGRPTKHRFTPSLTMPAAADTTSQRFYVPVPRDGGHGVDVVHFTRSGAGAAAGQVGRYLLSIYHGPAGTIFSRPTQLVSYATVGDTQKVSHRTDHVLLPGTATDQGSAEVTIQRTGTHVDDMLTADVILLGVEITTYEGVVGVAG